LEQQRPTFLTVTRIDRARVRFGADAGVLSRISAGILPEKGSAIVVQTSGSAIGFTGKPSVGDGKSDVSSLRSIVDPGVPGVIGSLVLALHPRIHG